MQAGKMFKKLDPVMAYRIAVVAAQPNGSYSLTLESATGLQLFTLSSEVAKAAQAPPEVGDYLVSPDHFRSGARYLVEAVVFDRNYEAVPEPPKESNDEAQ